VAHPEAAVDDVTCRLVSFPRWQQDLAVFTDRAFYSRAWRLQAASHTSPHCVTPAASVAPAELPEPPPTSGTDAAWHSPGLMSLRRMPSSSKFTKTAVSACRRRERDGTAWTAIVMYPAGLVTRSGAGLSPRRRSYQGASPRVGRR